MIRPLLFTILFAFVLATDKLNVAFQWKKLDFDYPSQQERLDALMSREFIPENNIPLGLEVYQDRLFITIPRWKKGVAASLAYINLSDPMESPVLKPYPNWASHQSNQENQAPQIVAPFRIRADSCGRLWVMDTGLAAGERLAKPKLLIYNLSNDQLISTYTIPDDQLNESSFFANIAVEENNCDDSFAYLADLGRPGLVVYSLKDNSSWLVEHHYFHIEPLAGNMNVSGIKFQWTDGLFGLALSKKNPDGFSTLYFHPMTSFQEFTVNTRVLQDMELATNSTANFHEFKVLGTRGNRSESGASFLHKKTGVLFYALLNLNAVACWRTSNPNYTMESQGRVFKNESVVFPNDVKVDEHDVLWVLFDNLPTFMYHRLNYREYNFRILKAPVSEAIKGTACDSKMVIDPTIMKGILPVDSSAGLISSQFGLICLMLSLMFSR